MKKPLAILCVALLLCALPACSRNGRVEDTESESTSLPQMQTDPSTGTTSAATESETQSETMTDTESETESASQSEQTSETENEKPMTDFSAFFDMTRDEIMGQRGESENTTADEKDTNLYYTDRYAGYEGQAGYAFGEDGTLSDISLTFPEGVTLEDVTEALEGLHGSSIDQNGVSTWHKDGITYQMLQENGKLILRVTRQENAQSDITTTTTD